MIGQFYRHRKGGLYRVLALGTIEATVTPAVIYQSQIDASVWVRPKAEFEDGRFTLVEPPLATEVQPSAPDGDRLQFLKGVLTTFTEDPTYTWWTVDEVHRDQEHWVHHLEIEELEVDEGFKHTIDVSHIELGIRRIVNGEVKTRRDLFTQVAIGSLESDAGEIDVEGADVIVQAALFNDLKYA